MLTNKQPAFSKTFVKAFPVVKSYAYSERVVKRATIFYNLELLNAISLKYPKHSTPLPFEMITIRALFPPTTQKNENGINVLATPKSHQLTRLNCSHYVCAGQN